jgi:hypothetical protein
MDTTAFYIVLFLHLVSLIVAFGSVLVIDVFGLLWICRRHPLSHVFKVAGVTQKLIWIGWAGLVASGIPLLVMKAYVDNLTKLKIFLVLLVGLNGLFLDAVKRAGEKVPEGAGPPAVLIYHMGLTSAISQLGWWGTVVIGFIHHNIEHVVQWPKNPWLSMGVIVAFFLGAYLAGKFIFRKKK